MNAANNREWKGNWNMALVFGQKSSYMSRFRQLFLETMGMLKLQLNFHWDKRKNLLLKVWNGFLCQCICTTRTHNISGHGWSSFAVSMRIVSPLNCRRKEKLYEVSTKSTDCSSRVRCHGFVRLDDLQTVLMLITCHRTNWTCWFIMTHYLSHHTALFHSRHIVLFCWRAKKGNRSRKNDRGVGRYRLD